MKHLYLSLRALLGAVLLLVTAHSQAGESKYYYYYEEFRAYPMGAGKIYASADKLELGGQDVDFQETMRLEACVSSIVDSKDFYCYGLPQDGRLFCGVSVGTKVDGQWQPTTDEEGNVVLSNTDSPARFSPTSTVSADTEAECRAKAPSEPMHCCFGVFTCVMPRVAVGQTSLGSVSSSRVVNDMGQRVTLTATPADEASTFLHWRRKSDGKLLSDNPLTLTVDRPDEYVAYFSNPAAHYFNMPEGGYIVWYNDNYTAIYASGTYHSISCGEQTLRMSDNERFYLEPTGQSDVVLYPAIPQLIYLQGEATLVEMPALNAWYTGQSAFSMWTGDEPLATSDLPDDLYYYNLNLADECFTLMPDDQQFIPASTLFLAIAKDNFEPDEAYQTIFWSEEAALSGATGIASPKATQPVEGIYTLGGVELRRLPAGRGLYIVGGRKVWQP